jgi:hypothetical protein
MNQPYSWLLVGAIFTGMCGIAAAQDTQPAAAPAKPAPRSTAQIDAGEPRANTSGSPTPSAPASNSGQAPGNAAADAPAPAAGSTAARKTAAKAAAAPKAPGAADRLNLGTATVTGDREQPKVMYIVPWKKSDIGDLSGKPMNSLLDEALAPVDRDEFKREVAYFDAVKADTSQNNAGNGAAKQVEK